MTDRECYLICRLCSEEIPYNPKCACVLGTHLINKHPEAKLSFFSDRCGPMYCQCKNATSSRGTCPLKKKSPIKSPLYKTTVETWVTGPVNVKCPSCGNFAPPCIRKQRNKVASTSFGAMCLVGCWPLCFLPFLSGDSKIHLYCKQCGTYLGMYNRCNGTLIPPKGDEPKYPANMCND